MEHKYTRKYWANGRWNYEYGDAKKSDTPANRPHSRPVNHVNGTAPVAKGQKMVNIIDKDGRVKKVPVSNPSDNVNAARKDGGRRSVQETSKEHAARRKDAAHSREVERYMGNHYQRESAAYNNSASARKVLDQDSATFANPSTRALKRRNDAIDAANAAIKSKKSVKRKLRKAKYAVSNAANAAKKQLKERQKYVRDRINKMK